MPTGYTAKIEEKRGFTFHDFAKECMKSFIIEYRDGDWDKDPLTIEFKTSDYHSKALEDAKKYLNQIRKLSTARCQEKAAKEFLRSLVLLRSSVRKNKTLVRRYKTILDQAKAWVPPTDKHVGYKQFMIEQLESSMDSPQRAASRKDSSIEILTGEQWREREIKSALWDIKYHEEALAKEIQNCADKKEWLAQLKGALGV